MKLFVWQILLTLVSLGAFAVLIGIPVASAWALGFFTNPSEHLLPLVLGGGVVLLVFLALVVVLAVVQVMTKDFVLPQMALEDISAMEGWRRLWELLKVEKGGYGGYIGMKIATKANVNARNSKTVARIRVFEYSTLVYRWK